MASMTYTNDPPASTPTELVMLEAINVVDSMMRVATGGELLAITLIVHPKHRGDKVNIVSNVPRKARGEVRVALEEILERWNASDH